MNISIIRDAIEIGEWTEEEVRNFYREGRLVDTDRYWTEGMTEWTPLSRLIRPAPPFPASTAPDIPIEPPPFLPASQKTKKTDTQKFHIPEAFSEGEANAELTAPPVPHPLLPLPNTSLPPLTSLPLELPPIPITMLDQLAGFKTRIAARTIDTALITVPALIFAIPLLILLGVSQATGYTAWCISAVGFTVAYDIAFLLWDVVWIGTIGTSPGKFIFGIKVDREDGEPMRMRTAWRRVWRLFYSLWFLIAFPPVTFALAKSKEKRFKETGTTPWDQRAGTIVIGKEIGLLRKSFGTILFILSAAFWLYVVGSSRQTHLQSQNPPLVDATTMPATTPAPVAPEPEPASSSAVVTVATDNAEAAGYRVKATSGDAVAARNLGNLYLLGQGVPLNYAEALKWLQFAADQGDADAQYNLGTMYHAGNGVAQDYGQALSWSQKAADQGNDSAQNNVGFMYQNGQGVAQDYGQALHWYQKAADQGNTNAQYNIGSMYFLGQGVAQDYSQALNWYQKAANQGDASAQYAIGSMYKDGQGVTQDYGQALVWCQKSAAQGDMYAQDAIGSMYENGNGVAQDTATAVEWYRKAAAQGQTDAQAALKRLGQ